MKKLGVFAFGTRRLKVALPPIGWPKTHERTKKQVARKPKGWTRSRREWVQGRHQSRAMRWAKRKISEIWDELRYTPKTGA
jgi:hypothetical protein